MVDTDYESAFSFLGCEFLLWLWFKSDCYESLIQIGSLGKYEVIIDDHLRLDTYLVDAERADLKGGAPAYSAEAKTALAHGKWPTKAKLRVVHEGREWVFSFAAETFLCSGIKVPSVLSKDDPEVVMERLNLVEELEEILETLYHEFLNIRMNEAWHEILKPAVQEWIKREGASGPGDYPTALKRFGEGKLATTLEYFSSVDSPAASSP